MPEDYELYYGFTRFAMELNELDLETAKILPKTDTRFRPDQRYKCYYIITNNIALKHLINYYGVELNNILPY